MQKTLGGDRLGSGNKMKVDLKTFNRSTFNPSKTWRTTMSAGTLVPFMSKLALPGDTWDIDLNCDVKTHPTIGPLFGSFKVQLDVFQAPIRLYHSQLHNNTLGIGLRMETIKFPVMDLFVPPTIETGLDIDNLHINPSCILAYLGLRGAGINPEATSIQRNFNGVPLLAVWDIYKNYYANKQEEIGAVIHTPFVTIIDTVDSITQGATTIPEDPATGTITYNTPGQTITINYTGTPPLPSQILLNTIELGQRTVESLFVNFIDDTGTTTLTGTYHLFGTVTIINWRMITEIDLNAGTPQIKTFPLTNIDDMRTAILAHNVPGSAFEIMNTLETPYAWLSIESGSTLANQEGLPIKTYQSDLFNNWLQTEWLDGVGGINEITAIDTSSGSFEMNTLILARKVYDMLNNIAVSDGTYHSWIEAAYDHIPYQKCETPIYHGGLIKELVFQEVVSNSQDSDQPLGTLAGKGIMSGKHKGGHVTIKVDEPSFIIGLISLTPRIDYSQGNDWTMNLENMRELHNPHLDGIGFQESILEQRAWWTTEYNGGSWEQKSAGKIPAWINYQTDINTCHGNFAIESNEMFMTLNRRYEFEDNNIKDLTTYIDPAKYNFIFAQPSLDAMNFWTQIAMDIKCRRKMSSRLMPNL